MWEHLSESEYARRYQSIRIAADFGMMFSSEWSPSDILGALAQQSGDSGSAVEYWESAGIPAGQGGAEDPLAPPAELRRYAESPSNWEALLANITTPSDVLQLIYEDQGLSPELAEHPGVPMSILSDALSEVEEEVMLAAAANMSLSEEMFFKLAELEDEDPWRPFTELRIALMNSPATPHEWLEKSPLDEEWLNSFSGPGDEVLRLEDIQVKVAQMRNPATDPQVLVEHLDDISGDVRAAVAENPRCPRETLWKLSVDPDAQVRRAAVANPRAPKELTGWTSGPSEDDDGTGTEIPNRSEVDVDELFNKGLEQQQLGKFDAAIEFYLAGAVAGDAVCAFKLGLLYGIVGDQNNSRWWYSRGSSMGNIPCMNALASIALDIDQDVYRARELCEQALASPDESDADPRHSKGRTFYILGYLDHLEGEYHRARENLRTASSMGVGEADALLRTLIG